jgi:CHASE2 domain-containing sensor protein
MTKRSPAERVHRRPFASQLLRAMPVMVVLTLLTAWADHSLHLFDSLNLLALDAFATVGGPTSSDVLLVTIGDDDYRTMFGNRSPLDPARLRTLIEAVLKQSPAVLGVDISTADDGDAQLREVLSKTGPEIVWVRDAFFTEPSSSRTATLQLDRVLGGNDPPPHASVGLSIFPQDADRLVRGYYRRVPLKTTAGDIAPPSLAWAIVEAYCQPRLTADPSSNPRPCIDVSRAPIEAQKDPADEPLWFNFAGESYQFRKVAAGAVESAPPGLFSNRIVLIGGTFGAGRDLYATPLGRMFGVELTALAIEVELHGGGITAANEMVMIAMDLAAGVLLVWINWRWDPASRLTVAMTAAAILGLAVLASYVAFQGIRSWASFVPVGVGVWLHSFYDRAREVNALRHELEECRKRHVTTR